ncbi:hypothetical protein [Pantanalinema sp. GBBB05]|uniref:hypothetical protein n=1 Tax=Pantanalinema sp. GBBB05 TaxID=2604139 RepID=UPI001DEA618B|nr:hypothetical protein [Pantanalinema sp. GBBB05]
MKKYCFAAWFLGIPILLVCQPAIALPPTAGIDDPFHKITFDLSQLSPTGLVGSGTGRRSLDYEFCIPATETAVTEIQAIDPTIQVYRNSRGRIGCDRAQYLSIGNTYHPQWRSILNQIVQLDYVERIDQSFGE